jgi:hypothetical protein
MTRFWREDKGLSVFSLALLAVIFVLPPWLAGTSSRGLVADAAFALLLLTGALALAERGVARSVLLPVAGLTLAVDLASRVLPVPEAWVLGADLASLLVLLLVVLAQTVRAGPVTPHRIQGGVAAYLLLGVIWAHAYALVALLRPGAFAGGAVSSEGPRGYLYFSFVTLTTVGYGDVLPVHPAARSLAMAEAVAGPLYLAVLLARLVSLAVTPEARGPAKKGT